MRIGAGVLRKNLFFPLFAVWLSTSAEELPPPGVCKDAIDAGIRAGVYQDVALGWIDGANHGFFFAGQASAERRFEIGALTEVFTGILLSQQAVEGRLRLQTTLRERLGDEEIAEPSLARSSLESLATRGVPLPATPPNLMPRLVDDPYADYGLRELRTFLANYRRPAETLGGYSPLQFGILGHALAKPGAGDVRSMLRDRVLLPLGLKHTDFEDDRLLEAHSHGAIVAHLHFEALAGSGGLRSTAGDLVNFLQANLRPENSPLRAALLLARQPHGDGDVGLGWNIKLSDSGGQRWPVVWRASITAGSSAFMAFRTDQQRGVVLLGDNDADLSALGFSFIENLPAPPVPRAAASETQPAALSEYAGLYKVPGGSDLIVREDGQTLWFQAHGEPAMRLLSDGQDIFDAGADALTVSFQREAGRVNGLVLGRAGINVLARRLSERAPHLARTAIAVEPRRLDEVAGDYQLGAALLRLVRHNDTLSAQITGRAAVSLMAFATDRFACADDSCELTVQRDADRNVTGVNVDLAGGQRFAARANWKVVGEAH